MTKERWVPDPANDPSYHPVVIVRPLWRWWQTLLIWAACIGLGILGGLVISQ